MNTSILRSVTSARSNASGFVLSIRARATVGLSFKGSKPYSRAPNQSVATTPLAGNWIATFLPEWRSLRTAFERTNNPIARAVRIFSRGQLLISNFCRAFEAAGKPFTFPLVQACKQASGSIFQALFLSPVLSAAPLIHADQHAARGFHNDGKTGARPGNSTARSRNYAC